MRLSRPALPAILAVALVAYAFDCAAVMTSEQAMQCCKSMRCSSHGHHGEECYRTMPAARAVPGLPLSVQGISFSPVLLGMVAAFDPSEVLEISARLIAAHSHAPPTFSFPPALPLRI